MVYTEDHISLVWFVVSSNKGNVYNMLIQYYRGRTYDTGRDIIATNTLFHMGSLE